MEVLKEAAPFVNHVTVLHDPGQRNHAAFLRVIATAAVSLDVRVSTAAVRDEAAIEQAIAPLADQTDRVLVILPGHVNNTHRRTIIENTSLAAVCRRSILSSTTQGMENCYTMARWINGAKAANTSIAS